MKMIMAIIPRDQAELVLQALVAANHTATFVETRGGMLRQAQTTLFIAVQDEQLEEVTQIIRSSCRSQPVVESAQEDGFRELMPAQQTLGGAVVFVWAIERNDNY
ncbi:MAG: cyclic-di-AMP receptor [Anaerolineae bacterium]